MIPVLSGIRNTRNSASLGRRRTIMARNRSTLQRYAIRGFSAAALTLSLLLPATALADGMSDLGPAITLHRSFNDNQLGVQLSKNSASQDSSQTADLSTGGATQTGSVPVSDTNTPTAKASTSDSNSANPDLWSLAQTAARSGDATAFGNTTWVGIASTQTSSAAASGIATATNNTGNADATNNGNASANGGNPAQGIWQATGDGGSPIALSGAKTDNDANATTGPVTTGSGGPATGKAACTAGSNNGNASDADKGTNKAGSHNGNCKIPDGNTGGASGGVGANANANTGGNATSGAATSGAGGASGSNTGSNWASADGGTAANIVGGGDTGHNAAYAIIAGGTSVNSLTVNATTSGNTSATSGAATDSGAATSSTSSTLTQSNTPSITQDLSNNPYLTGTESLTSPQKVTSGALTGTNTATQSGTQTGTQTGS